MTDDWGQLGIDMPDKHSCDQKPCRTVYNKEDRFIDPSSGRYSGSRWDMVLGTKWSIIGSMTLIIGGFAFRMPEAFIPAATLLGITMTANGAVYWRSTGKDFKCE